jgi:glycosyltransferase involved in cell wall biosynthesis
MGFPAAKIEAVVNGVDTVRFQPGVRPAARRHVGLPVEALVLGLVGRMDRGKRHLEMVNVFDQLAAAVPDLRLLLVGAGGDHEAQVLARISASAVTGRIHLAGYQEDPRCHYQAMDLLVVPSLREGFSNVVLEAMASGVPVLAHPTPGHAETITPAVDGFLADLATEANLLRQLQAAMAEPACLVELGKKAREKIATHYSLEGMAAHYARLYRELVRPPQGGAYARVKA